MANGIKTKVSPYKGVGWNKSNQKWKANGNRKKYNL